MKRQVTDYRRIFIFYVSDAKFIAKIYKRNSHLLTIQNNGLAASWRKSRDGQQTQNTYSPLVIKERQIKTTFTPTRKADVTKTDETRSWWGCRAAVLKQCWRKHFGETGSAQKGYVYLPRTRNSVPRHSATRNENVCPQRPAQECLEQLDLLAGKAHQQ